MGQPVLATVVEAEPTLVTVPFLVDFGVVAGQPALDLEVPVVDTQLTTGRTVLARRGRADEVERASLEAVVGAGQGTDRADLDDVAREEALVGAAGVDADLAQAATLGQRDEVVAADLGPEPGAALAEHAAFPVEQHLCRDVHRLRIGALDALVTRLPGPVAHGLVLQRALAALVANRAVQRMVDQQELQHARLMLRHGFVGGRSLDDHVGHHGQRAGRLRFHGTPVAGVGHVDDALTTGRHRV